MSYMEDTGQNPRKPMLLDEIADTVLTGVLAIQHFTKNTSVTRQIIREKLAAIEKRVPQ